MATDISIAMIAITIISSTSVNPNRRLFMRSPLRVGRPVARFVHALGVDIEHVLPAPGLPLRIVASAAQTPVVGVGHRIFRNPPQVFDLLVHRSSGLYAIHQLLQ